MALVAGVFSYVASYNEAHELQDHVLKQISSLYDETHLPATRSPPRRLSENEDEESQVIVQSLSTDIENLALVNNSVSLLKARTLSDGIYTLTIDDESYRVLVKTLSDNNRIAIAQETGLRDEIARENAFNTVLPYLIAMPLLLVAVNILIRRMLKPVTRLADDVGHRSEQELHPLSEINIPVEIKPFVAAINQLLDRVSMSIESQKRFVADTAHELRSPLTALSLQAERLENTEMSAIARERLKTLHDGIDRNRHLLEQLLSLARAQSIASKPDTSISTQKVYRRVLEDMLPLAEIKNIDLGIESIDDAEVYISEVDLITIVKNLVDNSIRYTSSGGRVDLSIINNQQGIIIQVTDSGPGIPSEERTRVLDAFYRIPGNDEIGSGLGLTIVTEISRRNGANISLDYADEINKTGLCVKVFFQKDIVYK